MSTIVEKTLKTRIRHRHATEEKWNSIPNFIPRVGELIFYDADNEHDSPRAKLGDGTTTIDNLPFVSDAEQISSSELDAILV